MKAYRIFDLLIVVSLLVAACGGTFHGSTPAAKTLPLAGGNALVISQGRLYPRQYADISFNSSGNVAEVLVKEGDTVTADQVIAQLMISDAEESTVASANKDADVARAQQDVLAAQQEVAAAQQEVAAAQQAQLEAQLELLSARKAITDMMDSTATALNLAQAQVAVANLQNQIDDAKRNMGSVSTNPIKVAQSQANIGLLQAQLAKAQSDAEKLKANDGLDQDKLKVAQDRVATAEASLISIQAGLAAAQAHVVAARARVAAAQTNLTATLLKQDSVELKAPFAGTVAVQNLKVGERVAAGQPMVTLADVSQWEVKTDDLTENEVVKISLGQNVTVALDALPDVTLTGVVTAVSTNYVDKEGHIIYTVTIALTNVAPQMRWGMTAEVTFEK